MLNRSGKNIKFVYYLKNGACLVVPDYIYRNKLKDTLGQVNKRKDYDYILQRVNYYNKLNGIVPLPENATHLSQFHLKDSQSCYFFDSFEHTRWFDKSLKWKYLFGDITEVPCTPSILKSRPVAGDNRNSVLLNLDKVRHFVFLDDRIPFSKKKDKAIFRGEIDGKPHRMKLMEMYFEHPVCDAGAVCANIELPPGWIKKEISLWKHLDYKFIFSIEGNDVASNLKWVMSSNSVAIMPKPTYETWFMEGTLIPNHHYIEIKKDYSDLEEKLAYYIEYPGEAEAISRHANEYTAQFMDKQRERIISLLVLEKYFQMTGQREINRYSI